MQEISNMENIPNRRTKDAAQARKKRKSLLIERTGGRTYRRTPTLISNVAHRNPVTTPLADITSTLNQVNASRDNLYTEPNSEHQQQRHKRRATNHHGMGINLLNRFGTTHQDHNTSGSSSHHNVIPLTNTNEPDSSKNTNNLADSDMSDSDEIEYQDLFPEQNHGIYRHFSSILDQVVLVFSSKKNKVHILTLYHHLYR